MLKYPQIPRLAYSTKIVNTMEVSESFEEHDKLSSERIGVYQNWYLVRWLCIWSGGQTGHTEIWTFKLNLIHLTLNVYANQSQKVQGSWPRCSVSFVWIWWFQLEQVMSFHADKLVNDTQADRWSDRHTRQIQATTIPKGQSWPRVKMNDI